MFNFQFFLIYSSLHYIYSISYILLSLDNDVLKTSKRRAMFYNILSQIFIVKCFTKSLLIRIRRNQCTFNFCACLSFFLAMSHIFMPKFATSTSKIFLFHVTNQCKPAFRISLRCQKFKVNCMKLPSTTENTSLIVYWSSCGSISRPVYTRSHKQKSSFEFFVMHRRKFAALEGMAR